MSYGRRFRRSTPPRLRLRKPRPYIRPRPKGPPLTRRARLAWGAVYAALVAAGILLIVLTRH
jgi:hypothetical protein